MRARFYWTLAVFMVTGLAFPVLGQITNLGSDQSSAGRKDAPEKVASVKRAAPVKHRQRSFSMVSKITSVLTRTDGAKITSESEQITAQDSLGRSLGTGSNNGSPVYTALDPISGTLTVWNTHSGLAKAVKLPEAVPGRKSCWKIAPEDLNKVRGEVEFGVSGTTCQPAGRRSTYCIESVNESSAVVKPSSEDSPEAETTFEDCTRNLASTIFSSQVLEKKEEDLGTQTIQGFVTHGCRVTTKYTTGTHVRELWLAKRGLDLRRVDEEPLSLPGMSTSKRSMDLISLSLQEPDLTTFQPPADYEIKTVEMHEVPCEQPKLSTQSRPVHLH
jgi:hypothetical protein